MWTESDSRGIVYRMTYPKVLLLLGIVVSLAVTGCSATEPSAPETVTVTRDSADPTAEAAEESTAAPTAAPTAERTKDRTPRLRAFWSPSRALYCQGGDSTTGCSVMTTDTPANTPNALSCDSERYTLPTAIGAIGDKIGCWWTTQWGLIPEDTPTLDYGQSAVLDSGFGDITCGMEFNGVTCMTADKQQGWFASRQEYKYLTDGRWYPSAP